MTTLSGTNCLSPVDPINTSWAFSPFDNSDLTLWESRSIGSRFFIGASTSEFLPGFVADNGAIITIQENEFNFIISTIQTPRSGTQPFSGKRMWGIRTNADGNFEIYTRAIDRANPVKAINFLGSFDRWFECDDHDYFDIAHRTWTNLQTQVARLIMDYEGVVRIKTPIDKPKFDFRELYKNLKSPTPVNFVSCQ